MNSFGYGGTNAHIIIEGVESFLPGYKLEQAKVKSRGEHNRQRPFLLPFSAHDRGTLNRNIAAFSQVVNNYNLHDLSYTLANRRTHLQSRGFLVVSNGSVRDSFKASGEGFSYADRKRSPTIGFAFTGQGAQWARMGSQLMMYYPSFTRTIKKLDFALENLPDGPDWTLEDMLLEDAKTSRVNEAKFSQPLCTAIQIGIVELLAHWGVRPTVTVGHSSGEIAAAFAAGLISATEAIIVAYCRGNVVCDLDTNGAMLAVGLGAEDTQPYIEEFQGKVVIACHNSPSSVTLSGDADAINAIEVKLVETGIFARPVKTGGKAYHSHHMKTVSSKYQEMMLQAKAHTAFESPLPSSARMVSSVTNSKLAHDSVLSHGYWSKNLVSPVLFNQAIQTIATDEEFSSVDLLIEIGPHSALSGPIRQICISNGFDKLGYLPTLIRNEDAAIQLLKVAGELYLRDYKLDMERVTCIEAVSPGGKIVSTQGSILVNLPTYQWNYAKNLWAEPRQSAEHRAPRHDRHDILGRRVPGDSAHNPTWRNVLRIRDVPWLRHHSLGGEAVFPAAGYFSMAMEAITQLNENRPNPVQIHGYVLRDVTIKAALVTPDDDNGIETMLTMHPSIHSEGEAQSTWWDFNVSSISSEGTCNDHMTGTIGINIRERSQKPKVVPNLPHRASGKSWNQALKDVGFNYGTTFRDMDDIQSDGKNFVAASKTALKRDCGIMEGESRHIFHPSTVDSCLQLIIVSIYAGRINDMTCGAVPIQVDEVAIWPPTAKQLDTTKASAFSWTDQRGIRSFVSGSELVACDGEVLMHITDMRCVAYEAAVPQRLHEAIETQPYLHMVWKQDIDSLGLSKSSVNMDIDTLVEHVAHKRTQAKILMIGSKDVKPILLKSKPHHCTVTYSSDAPLDSGETLTAEYKDDDFIQIDLSTSLDNLNISEGIYDFVVAPEGLQNSHIIRNIHRLLSSGGRLVLERVSANRLSAESLRAAGFSGIDFKSSKFVLSTAMTVEHKSSTPTIDRKVLLVYRKQPDGLVTWIEKAAEEKGWSTRKSELDRCDVQPGEHVVLLADLDSPLLASLQEKELRVLQHISSNASSILWVTRGGLLNAKEPAYGMTAGLARSLTSENALLDLTTLDFDLDSTPTSEVVRIIVASTERQLEKGTPHESEYYVANGEVCISRLEPLNDLNATYTLNESDAEAIQYDSTAHLTGKIQPGKLVFEVDPRTDDSLGANEVEVQVVYAGLNKEDADIIKGTDYPTTFSHEIYGQITNVGSAVDDHRSGDYVFGFSFNKFGTFQRTSSNLVLKVSEKDRPEEVATLPIAYATALHGLGTLEENEIVLILHGTGVCGIAALRVCHWRKAKAFIVVESQAEAEKLMTECHLTRDQIIYSSEKSLPKRLSDLTNGHGADVVFSSGSVDSNVSRECWRCIAPFGRFVDFGRKNVLKRSVLDSLPLHHGANYHSFDLVDLYQAKPQVLAKLLQFAYSLHRQNLIPAIKPVRISHLAKLDTVVSSFSQSFTQGKALISYEKADHKINVLPSTPSLRLRPDATYLLVGALGGLGRSLGSWMMERGARHFTFMARSGTDSKQAAILVADMRNAGASVQVIRGDATIRGDVDRALKSIPLEYPVRGVVHAAMVLRVCYHMSTSMVQQLMRRGLGRSLSQDVL